MKNPCQLLASCLALMVWLVLSLPAVSAPEDELPPTPDQVTGPDETASHEWAESVSRQPSSRRPSQFGTMSGWDLYAGSVYANTSPVWFHAEGLVWWLQGNRLPALVTTSPTTVPRDQAGVLGDPHTSVLFGDERVDDQVRGGFRTAMGVRLGHWFDSLMDSELEFGVMWLGDGQTSGDFYAASLGDPILARPFYNAALDAPDSQLIAFPDLVVGDILIETSSDLLSTGAVVRQAWLRHEDARLDWLAGYRYARLREELYASEHLISTELGGPIAFGTTFDVLDEFRTRNEFHGGDLGLQLWTHMHGWTVEVLGKVAVGAVARTVEINGSTLVEPGVGDASLTSGGLLTAPTNIGRYQSCRFSALPELTIRFRRPISRFFTFSVGYTAMLLDHVVRTGDQLDVVVNPTQLGNGVLAGPPRPTVLMNDSTLWVHGLTIGLEW